MLTGKQKRFLRSEAHHVKPIFQVGQIGVNENMIEQMKDALEKRELIKVIKGTEDELVKIIGNNIVLYKESLENKQLQLP